jgi:hypothetical protein
MIPLFEKEGFIICFEALPEEIQASKHFIDECGWNTEQFEKIDHFDFFCAKVSAHKDGKELGSSYMGCCSYENASDFYTNNKHAYFSDMVEDVLSEAKSNQTQKANKHETFRIRAVHTRL